MTEDLNLNKIEESLRTHGYFVYNQKINNLKEKYDFVFLDHWKDEYLSDLKTIQRQGLLNDKAVIFADNVVLFKMDDYLSYVRNSSTFESKFISTMREYSKTQPDGIEISIFNNDD